MESLLRRGGTPLLALLALAVILLSAAVAQSPERGGTGDEDHFSD